MSSKKFLVAIVIAALIGGGAVYLFKNKTNTLVSTSSSTQVTSGASADYSSRGLTSFPQDALNNTNIVSLDLSNNSLTGALPSQIQKLSKLEVLNVSNNNMTGIPAEVGQLSKLKVLNYANNQITGLPNELGNLTQLQTLDLSGNPKLSQQDLNGIRAKLKNTDIKL